MTSSIECKNFLKSLKILNSFVNRGVEYFILCPGNRSAPLAMAAWELFTRRKVKLFNSIDERSAGFHALGIASASGKNVIVITTSGTAVANLLPSAVEADRSCNGIIFITADRPLRLKDCGANQTVNQEEFLLAACRASLSTDLCGLHQTRDSEIENLIKNISDINLFNNGPIHLNIPLEKPLMISNLNKSKILKVFEKDYFPKEVNSSNTKSFKENIDFYEIVNKFNFSKTGLIIVGPYRGSITQLSEFNNSLEKIQELTGWPVFADPLSGVKPSLRGIVEHWELVISSNKKLINFDQLLRLGPMPTSDVLVEFLQDFNGTQFLIKENESRKLDPLKKAIEYDFGLQKFLNCILDKNCKQIISNKSLRSDTFEMIKEGKRINKIITNEVLMNDQITELSLANLVPKIWPRSYPIMLAASSPIRDWLRFSGNQVLTRRCFSFRGASGIDGTLSMALGIARILDPLLLVTGDLSFLHDINGWLNQDAKNINLKILLIDNNGGNIFNRLHKDYLDKFEIEKLFTMRRYVNWSKLAEAHDIPYVNVLGMEKLNEAFEWSLSIKRSVIIRVNINLDYEIKQRENIEKYISQNK